MPPKNPLSFLGENELADIQGIQPGAPAPAPGVTGAPGAGAPGAGAGGQDLLADLLGQLEFQQAPQAPRTGLLRGVGGALADALTQRARVLAGAAPLAVAPFAAEQQRQRQVFEQQTLAAETANRDIRNRIRIKGTERKLQVIDESKKRKQDITDDIEALKRQSDKELRRVLAQEVTSRGLIPDGKSLTTMTTAEMSDALSEQDPSAHLDAQLKAVPDGFEVSFEIDERGRVSIKGRQPSADDKSGNVIPTGTAGLLAALVREGADSVEGTALAFGTSKNVAKALANAAEENFKKKSQRQAKVALQNLSTIEHPPGTDPTISQVSDQARDLLTLSDSGASPERVADYYFQQIDAGAGAVEAEKLTVPQLRTIIENLINMIGRTFGDEVVEEIRSSKRGKNIQNESEVIRSGEPGIVSGVSPRKRK